VSQSASLKLLAFDTWNADANDFDMFTLFCDLNLLWS
jgi:hypothetical protein